mgnify:CR=1 FL=1
MPVSEKQKGYARKWDKENMHTISTRVRMEEFKDYKAWCEMRGVTVTSEIKRFVMGELDKYYAELDRLHEEEMKNWFWLSVPFCFIFDFFILIWYNAFNSRLNMSARQIGIY